MIAAVVFSNTYWTFWDVFFFLLFFVPLIGLWFFAIFDVFSRRDMSGWGKALWLLAIIFVPFIGVICYFLFSHLAEAASYEPG